MMNSVSIILLISVAIGFAGILISGLIKLIFFDKQDGAYRRLLKFAFLSEAVGLIIMFIFLLLFKDNSWAKPERIIAIPFYFMLAGVMTGFILQFRYGHKTKN